MSTIAKPAAKKHTSFRVFSFMGDWVMYKDMWTRRTPVLVLRRH